MRHLLLCLVVLVSQACATSPTGRKQVLLLPPGQMSQMGAQAFTQMQGQVPRETSPQVNAYVKCVANAVTAEVGPPEAADGWEVVVFKDDSANAFALPGGKIGVHTGLLKVAKTQDQLAAVIGHEIAHVTANHGNERVSTALGTQLTLATANKILTDRGSSSRPTLMALLGVGAQFGVALPHGRSQESEADVVGIDYMARAGFDPQESVQLWKNMGAASNGAQPPEWLSTHPSHENRIAGLQSKMNDALAVYRQARLGGRTPHCKP